MADRVRVCPLGGLDEIGRDCYVLEINDDIFVLDFGLSFADKTIPGIDYLLPNNDYIVENKHRVKAYILTHGHDEVMGGIKYLYSKAPAPIYCTFATRLTVLGQCSINGIKNVNFNFVEVKPTSTHVIAGHKVHFFQTCHNAPHSFGVVIETDRGNIIYSGDFIIDYTVMDKEFYFDLNALSTIAETPTLLLMCESKAADRDGFCAPKHRLIPRVEKYFSNSDKRIFICTFWQNLYRVAEIFKMCRQNKKKVYPYDKYTREIVDLIINSNQTDAIKREDILKEADLLRVRQQDVVILILGKETELYETLSALSERKNEDRRIVLGQNDLFIISSVAIPYLETLATQAADSLYRTGCEVVWIKKKELLPMHAHQDDIKLLLSLLRPKYYLPVRGSFVNLMANAKLALSMGIGLSHSNVFIIDNGMQLVIDEQEKALIIPNDYNKIPIHPIMVDGLGISKLGHEVVQDRMKLSIDGVVVIAASISKKTREIVAGPDCQMRGFVFVKEAEPILKTISQIFVEEVNNVLASGSLNFDPALEIVKDRTKKFIRRENGREPFILPIVIMLD